MDDIRIENVYAELLKSLIKPNLPGCVISKSLVINSNITAILSEICGKSVDRIIDEDYDELSKDTYRIASKIIPAQIVLKCKLPKCTPVFVSFNTHSRYIDDRDYIFPTVYASNGYTFYESHRMRRVGRDYQIEETVEQLKQRNLTLKHHTVRPILRARREKRGLGIKARTQPSQSRRYEGRSKKRKVYQVVYNIPQLTAKPESKIMQDLALLIKQAGQINVNRKEASYAGITAEGEILAGSYSGFWDYITF